MLDPSECLCFLLHQTPKKVGAMWTDAGLNWSDFLPEDQDVNKFVTDQVCGLWLYFAVKTQLKTSRNSFIFNGLRIDRQMVN